MILFRTKIPSKQKINEDANRRADMLLLAKLKGKLFALNEFFWILLYRLILHVIRNNVFVNETYSPILWVMTLLKKYLFALRIWEYIYVIYVNICIKKSFLLHDTHAPIVRSLVVINETTSPFSHLNLKFYRQVRKLF